MKELMINQKKKFILFAVFFFVLTVLVSYFLLTGRFSFSSYEGGWDGQTVAIDFVGGNGTYENPYIISTPEEFIYFKSVIEGDSSLGYQDKYYVLSNDLDFNQFPFSSIGVIGEESENIFRGHLDGAGHTLRNIVIQNSSVSGETSYYGLFNKMVDGRVENLLIDNLTIKVGEEERKVIAGSLVGFSDSSNPDEPTSFFKNISITNYQVNTSGASSPENEVNAFIGYVTSSQGIHNIILEGSLVNNDTPRSSFVIGGNSPISSIIDNVHLEKFDGDSLVHEGIEEYYSMIDGGIYLEGEFVGDDAVLFLFNQDIKSDYYWVRENGVFSIQMYQRIVEEAPVTEQSFTFSMRSAPNFAVHDSGIDTTNGIVYINDLDADYDYYMGLNYTTPSDSDIPSTSNKNLYGDNNLKKFEIIYRGALDSTRKGTVSYESGENQTDFIYYKYYPVSGNSIDIELIDNPYAGRPYNMGFNGWVSTDSNVVVYLDDDSFVYHAIVPVTSNETVVEFYASWVEATMDDTDSNNDSIRNALDSLNNKALLEASTWEMRTRLLPIIDNDEYYYTRVILNRNDSQAGYYSAYGGALTGTCNSATCTVYDRVAAGSDWDENTTYYHYYNYAMRTVDPRVEEQYRAATTMYNGMNMGGFYEQKVARRNESIDGCRNLSGARLTGNCANALCTVYSLIPFYDENNNPNILDVDKTYYYLVTRDTNFVYLNSYSNTANKNYWTSTKPFTLTSYYNGVDSRATAYYDFSTTYMKATGDDRVEYVQFYSSENGSYDGGTLTTGATGRGIVYGNFQNFKIGRGITSRNGYKSAIAVTATDNYTKSTTYFRLAVESGSYTYGGVLTLRRDNGTWNNPNGRAVFGSDYDRVKNDNSKLEIYKTLYGSMTQTINCSNHSNKALDLIIKSGTIGRMGIDGTVGNLGIYVSSNSSGVVGCSNSVTVEGGRIFTIYGGPGPSTSMQNYNAIFIYHKGGVTDAVFGGGAYLTTNGNRIVSVTGGTVNYGVAGASNGYAGNDNDRKAILTGDSYVYVGGHATIGDTTLDDKLYDIDVGSVFGSANGRSGYNSVGSSDNSYVVINGGTINGNVYGGGNYGAVAVSLNSGTHESKISIVSGTIKGSVYGGGNNNGAGNPSYSTQNTVNTSIEMTGGTVEKSIYGGSRTKGTVFGSSSIHINGGNVLQDVYGGGEGGYRNNNNPGTYVRSGVSVLVDSGTIGGNVYGGSAYGSVNTINQNTNSSSSTTTVVVNGGTITGNVFGGGKGGSVDGNNYTPKVVGNITVDINGGSMSKVFGGFDESGRPSNGDVVNLNGGTIGNAFGGGNKTSQTTTNINLTGSTITGNLYGGSNLSGTVTTTNVTATSGSVAEIFGGNNLGGSTGTTNVSVTGSLTVSGDIYGGGNEASVSTKTNVTITNATVHDVYGGGKGETNDADARETSVTITGTTGGSVFGGSNASGTVDTSGVTITNSTFTNAYGGNNQGGETDETHITVTGTSQITNVFGGGDNASSGDSNVTISGGTITNVYGGGNEAGLDTSEVTISGGTVTSVFGGSNTTGDVSTSHVWVSNDNAHITTVYGGNNLGGTTVDTNIAIAQGEVGTVFGGGNKAPVGTTTVNIGGGTIGSVYAGGNEALVSGSTYLDIDGGSFSGSIFGGGNEGLVNGSTEVFVTDANVLGNIYAGGNGSTAIVQGDSTVTIDGATVVGTASSDVPREGCVFGSGNAASTGVQAEQNSTATVNIAGGVIYGNVYGGPRMAVVYGETKTNIGMSAITNSNTLTEDDIHIYGTVFGGGESNDTGSTNFDWTFISVTQGIDININGTGYEDHSHEFIINGSIFGSGNASSSSGPSSIYIKNLGTMDHPNQSISIQRTNELVVDASCIELAGITDSTNDYSDIYYSFNLVDHLTIKNGTTLLLQHNANKLESFYSGVDSGGTLVPATVTINDDTKTVTKNVDNRLYMLPGQVLNIAVNQAATSYGEVYGMTFFGMYQVNEGNYRYGLYGPTYDYGDAANASAQIIGGSYVVGLRKTNHDITKDGFYSNYLKDGTFDEIKTQYIDPEDIGETGYQWLIGFDAINYEFTLTASKYASLGTYELQMIHFAEGNTTFKVLGFNVEGMDDDVTLVDVNDVPRVADTEDEANTIFGLSMKAETSEWTGYGTTKYLDTDGGDFTGTDEYLTDNKKMPPSLMFYLYHAKNITRNGNIGDGIISVQASIPRNAVEDEIKFINITVHMKARDFGDGDSYDASITYDKKYEMPALTDVNITNQSQFTAYFSLISYNEQFSNIYGNTNSYKHMLITNDPLPVNTVITMMDFGAGTTRPLYYYYRITQADYTAAQAEKTQYDECTYLLSKFIKMDSTSSTNTYDDASSNLLYYDTNTHLADEEFMFIFDFKETNVTGTHLNNHVSFELRDNDRFPIFIVLGIRDTQMYYSTYDSSNAVLLQTFTGNDNYLYYNVEDEFDYATAIQYNATGNNKPVIDTNYESSKMGLNVIFLDSDGEQVTSSLLVGTSIRFGRVNYYADGNGVFRIKLANKVSNIERPAGITVSEFLPPGQYTVRYSLFASSDGLHNASSEVVTQDFVVNVVGSENSITAECDDTTKLVDGETGKNAAGTTTNTYTVKYESQLSNPNFRIEIYKRNIDDVNSITYTSVPFSDLFTNNFTVVSGNEVSFTMTDSEEDIDLTLNSTLTSGTYRVVFKLYDNDQVIDEDIKYVIVKKKIE